MQKKEDLIQENIELRSRLEFAEKWIRREIQGSISKIQKERSKKSTRIAINNVFEQEGLDILTKRILDQFDDSLDTAPKYTLERLIDAEIYWNTLQKYPQMDALPIILAYQKIFDAWIEEKLVSGFRHPQVCKTKRGDPGAINKDSYLMTGLLRTPRVLPTLREGAFSQGRELEALEKDIQNIISKKYTLSVGRLYQILSLLREGKNLSQNVGELVSFWQEKFPDTFKILLSDEFYTEFTELMDRELFTRKRHESKVTYSDAKKIREIMIDETSRKSFLEMVFSI